MGEQPKYTPDDISAAINQKTAETPEIIVAPELNITPESILASNQSQLAQERNYEFAEAKKRGKMAFRWGCIDARRERLNITETMGYETVAAGGDPRRVERAINNAGIGFGIVESHHGPEIKGESPKECAGREAKDQELKNGDTKNNDDEGLGSFVSNDIKNSDVILQAAINGAEIVRFSEKPVAVSAQNHRTGEIKVISVSQNINGIVRSQSAILNQGLLYQDQYDPEELYANGVPFIPIDQIENDIVRQYFEKCANELREIKEKDRDFEKKHILHNPDMMVVLTDLRSPGIILPDFPSCSIVRLTIPRSQKLDDKTHVKFELGDLKKAWGQAEYVITHATKNYGQLNKPFSKMKTVFFATSNYDQARDLAIDLTSRQFMLPWLQLEKRQIIISEIKAGKITTIGEFLYEHDKNKIISSRDVIHWKKD